ncbi:MAG: acylneuraminate cytidylyltransferase family protein [Candidatus Rokubacteria bacterium]|nr:acylneuraminate cytidylyltransferase family protein [Candidatus Rokubacteria bacterium]
MLCLIPARGGSKRLPRKNLQEIAGKPLLAYTVEAALGSGLFRTVDVSTEDDEIAQLARAYGARVPYRRPAALATDAVSRMEVLFHHLEVIGPVPDDEIVVVLQVTCPFCGAGDIAAAVQRYEASGADTLVTVTDFPHPPQWALREDHEFLVRAWPETPMRRSQEMERLYCPSGAIQIGRVGVVRQQGTFYGPRCAGFYMPREKSLDIDEELDLRIARALMKGS